MIDFSVLLSVVMALVLGGLTFGAHKLHLDSHSPLVWVWIYLVVLIISGVDFVARQKKISGWTHGVLMFGVGLLGLYGAATNQKQIGGGTDNAVAGIYALQALVSLCLEC